MMSHRLIFVALLIASSLPLSQATGRQPQTNYRFINGQWFDGQKFRHRTFYSEGGTLRTSPPKGSFQTVDLHGKFVVPPFVEAHNHNVGSAIHLDRTRIRQTIEKYLQAGIFYVKIPGNPAENAAALRKELVNRPNSIDVSFANGVLTSKDGHPIGMTLDSYKQAGMTPPRVSELDGKSWFIIENSSDLNSRWESILAGKPDFIKVILRHSENFDKRRPDPALFGFNGLDPKLLPAVIRKAHAAKLRVAVHIDSGYDFGVAVQSGADEICHLPGSLYEVGTEAKDYEIRVEDAKLAARKGVTVVTTTNIANMFAKGDLLKVVQAMQKKNLSLLKKEGVHLAIGSDNFIETSLIEAMNLKSFGIFTNAELLRMWCEDGARTVFPKRKIGILASGYEASFLVLNGDPLKDFDRVKDIDLRFKDGAFLEVVGK